MRCSIGFAAIDFKASRGAVPALLCLALLATASVPCKADDLVDVSALSRLPGAQDDPDHASSSDDARYNVPGSVAATVVAVKALFAAGGWKPFLRPLETFSARDMEFKKGPQGVSVDVTMVAGHPDLSGVTYNPNRLIVDLPLPEGASDIVYEEHRPYLNCIGTGTIDATLDFFQKNLFAAGWSALSATDAVAHWPNAKLEQTGADRAVAYYIRDDQRPILVALQQRSDSRIKVEIKVAPFAEPQFLDAGREEAGLPVPKAAIASGGSGGDARSEVTADIPAEISTALAFYRRELTSRNWQEQAQGAVINPDEVGLTFTSPDGTVTLKLTHAYDLTTANLVLQVSPAVLAARAKAKKDADDQFMKDAQDLVNTAIASDAKRAASAQASDGPAQALAVLADSKLPVPLPETATDVDYDSGRLEFNSSSSFNTVVAFYRSVMKPLGWKSQPSVINAPNLVELDFSKGGKDVAFTIMRMGNGVNVTADGSALESADAKAAAADAGAQSSAAAAPATTQDLEAEDSGGLPVPKDHTMSEGSQTPFRHQITASVPADLPAVLAFYRRELGKLNWTEAKGAAVSVDSAVVMFSSSDGPAVLKLGRGSGETSVNLAVRNADAAAKAGILPKAGQAKILFGNALPAEAAITINNKTVKVSGGAGTKGPDGPALDLAPGKYPYSIKMASKPGQNDNVEVGADETWGLLIGPGGALPMQMY